MKYNFVNAIHYNCSGGTAEMTAEQQGAAGMLCVKDTGIGIPQESLERMS